MESLLKDEYGYYAGILDSETEPYHSDPHTFYKLKGLIPLNNPLLNTESYVENESHWIAIWDNKINGENFFLRRGDIVRF